MNSAFTNYRYCRQIYHLSRNDCFPVLKLAYDTLNVSSVSICDENISKQIINTCRQGKNNKKGS